MRQRASLIRTLVTKPEILLLDEAFSALDYQTRLAVTDDVYQIIKKEHKTTIMAVSYTHLDVYKRQLQDMVDIVFNLDINVFRGERQVQVLLKDLRFSD